MCRVLFVGCSGCDNILFQSFPEPAAYLYALLHPNKRIYLIVTNNLTGHKMLSGRKRWLQRSLFSKVSGVIVHTRYEQDLLRKLYPKLPMRKVFVKPFHKISVRRDIPRLESRRRRISFFGRSAADRGLDDFLRMAELDHDRRFCYGVYGRIALTDEQKKRISAIETDLEIGGDYLSDEEYYRLIGESLFIALPYKKTFEGRTSGVLCDAIACGTPVVASKIEPHLEYFEKYGPLGHLVDFSNTKEVVDFLAAPQDSWDDFQMNLATARQENSPERVLSCMLKIMNSN